MPMGSRIKICRFKLTLDNFEMIIPPEWPLADFMTLFARALLKKVGYLLLFRSFNLSQDNWRRWFWRITPYRTDEGFLTSCWVCLFSIIWSSYSHLANFYVYYLLVESWTQSRAQANYDNLLAVGCKQVQITFAWELCNTYTWALVWR